MTNRSVAAMAFAALVLSVLALFVALGTTDDRVTSPATEVVPPTTASVAIEAPSTTAARPAANAPDEVVPVTPPTAAEPPSTAAATPATTAPLPGTPSAVGPAAGTQLGVVGVSHDDFLNVRDVPNGNVVATLTLSIANSASGEQSILVGSPEAAETIATLDVVGVTATGRTRGLRTSTWHEIQAGPITGWASRSYLAPLSPDTRLDVTAQVLGAIGPTPSAPTMTELAQQVAAEFASDEPPSRIRFTSATSAFEALAELTVDVVGQPDDSVRGYRLWITAETAGDWMAALTDGDINTDAGPYTLRSVAATPLCYSHRGVGSDGNCN